MKDKSDQFFFVEDTFDNPCSMFLAIPCHLLLKNVMKVSDSTLGFVINFFLW